MQVLRKIVLVKKTRPFLSSTKEFYNALNGYNCSTQCTTLWTVLWTVILLSI